MLSPSATSLGQSLSPLDHGCRSFSTDPGRNSAASQTAALQKLGALLVFLFLVFSFQTGLCLTDRDLACPMDSVV